VRGGDGQRIRRVCREAAAVGDTCAHCMAEDEVCR
jgi:hypothetical protein